MASETHFSCHPLPPFVLHHPSSLPECKPRFRHAGIMAAGVPAGIRKKWPQAGQEGRDMTGMAECADYLHVPPAFPFAVSGRKTTGI
ncbi:hypothetical protein [Bacteroides caccae]|uniref:hypothetical protein n=1 Tax=Bacteroides caccae TaxID=47678 RepID=UPI001230A65A|nr:hypothetical protein F2Y49_23910 [Bacteroides caccae]